jgi:hypothetical protein
VGKEHEDKAGKPWTENQVYWSARIDVALRALCPAFGKHPPVLRLNMWEHRWLSATSCPSGRNPWHAKFALINEWEDDMGMTEAEKGQMSVAFSQIAWLRVELGLPHEFDASQEHDSATLDRFNTAMSQIAWLRAELGLPPQFDDSQAHLSSLYQRMDEIKAAVGGGDHRHPHQHGEAG